MDAKYHETSIDSIIELSNGDIAVSGGPLNFEVLIYRNQLYNEYEASSHYQVVDSISTGGKQV